jgi:streptogramin lyase
MKRRARGPVICLVCCVAGLAGSPGVALGNDSPSEGAGVSSPLSGSLVVPESLDEGEELQAEREAKLLAPEAVAARQASRTKFESLSTEQAAEVARETYPEVIDDPAGGPPKLPVGESIAGYPSDNAAQVDLGEGQHGVVESLVPMAIEGSSGQRVPVDLSLSAVGSSFEPKTPVVGVRIPKQLGEGVQLADSGVSLMPVNARGVALAGAEGLVDGASVLYANTLTDTDTVIKPVTMGFDANTILRSVESPQQLAFKIGLPEGASLVEASDGSGAVEVVKEGATIAMVLAPSARDAEGTAVPVSMAVMGDTLSLTVDDRVGEYEWPVEVDPEVLIPDNQLVGPLDGAHSNWKFGTSSEAMFGHEPDEGEHKDEGTGKGYLETSGIAEYKEAEKAFWAYETKGVSKIYEVSGIKAEGKNKGAEIESFVELEGGGTSENKYKLSTETYDPEFSTVEHPVQLCAKNSKKEVECASSSGASGNVVRFQQSVQKKPSNYKFSDILHGAVVNLSEPEGTHSTTRFNTTSKEVEGEVENEKKEKIIQKRPNALYGAGGWLSKNQDALEPIAEDKGIGFDDTKLEYESSPGKWEQIVEHNYLTKGGCEGVQCFTKHGEYFTLPERLPNGEDKIRYRAEEAIAGTESLESEKEGETVVNEATVKVDTSKPHSIALLGLPYGGELSERPYELTAEATDGEGSVPSSGIKSIAVYVDGKSIEDKEAKEVKEKKLTEREAGEREGECSAPKGECTGSARYTINGAELGAGHDSIQVVVFDNAGNEGRLPGEGTEISVRHSTPVALGPGSVDLESGDFSLGASDVSMGSGLTVSRAYSSRDLTAGSNGPLGPQWSISLASATSLVELADDSMLMTAANGSQTIFAATLNSEDKPTGKFEAPPGDSNVELTLEENEKKEKLAYYLKNAANETSVKFTLPSGGGKTWMPTRQEGAVKTDTVTYAYQTVEVGGSKITEPTEELAPVPAEVSCPTGKLNAGCRALKFTYATKTKEKIGENAGEWGEYTGRLIRVSYEGYNPATGKMLEKAIPVAEYAYDEKGRLRAEWDPRVSPALKTIYGYDSEGHVTALTPPGQESWVFTYAPIAGDTGTGRLLKAAQAPASAPLWGGELPADTEAPKITETTPKVGVAISVSHGVWSNNPVAYTFQWEDCKPFSKAEESERGKKLKETEPYKCTPIPGATNSSYEPVLSDVGYKLVVKVGAANGGGTVVVASAVSSEVLAAADEYSVPSGGGSEDSIAAGPEGDLWFTQDSSSSKEEGGVRKLGKITTSGTVTEYVIGGVAHGITVGPENNLWFTEPEANKIGKITPEGAVTEYSLSAGSDPMGITTGPDKNLWFTEWEGEKIGKITPEGKVTTFSLPHGGRPRGITTGPDGNLWFTMIAKEPTIEKGSESRIGKMTPSGSVIGEYSLPTEYPEPESIVSGPDGNLWFTTSCDLPCDIWKVTTSGKMTAYPKPEHDDGATITVGPEGKLWYTDDFGVGNITTGGVITEAPEGVFGTGIAAGQDGNLWRTAGGEIQKILPASMQGDPSPQPGWTMEYGVPLSGAGAPHEMGLNKETHRPEPEKWGQKDDPVEATAIIPPDSPQGWPASSYKRATMYYLDEEGRAVNVAQPSTGTYGSISTTEYNEENDVVRTLSPDNRAAALAAGLKEACEPTKCKSAEVSDLLDTVNVYNEPNEYGEPAGCRKETAEPEKETAAPGARLCETWGPQHEVKYVPNGYKTQTEALARNHMKYFYEDYREGAPETVEGKKQVYDLVTATTDLAELEKGSEEQVESRKTTTSYSGQSGLGWTLRAPTSVTDATETGGAKLEHKTIYVESGEAMGQVKAIRGPEGLGGESAHDSRIVYYTSEENKEGYAGCGQHPEWAGLICKAFPAKQPPEVAGLPKLPIVKTTYNIWDEPEKVEETFEATKTEPAVTRTKIETYDEAGRLTTSRTTSTSTKDIALPTVTDEYNKETGILEKQCANEGKTCGEGKPETITSSYNTLGQLTEYTDADGSIAKYKYGGPEKDGLIEEISDSSDEGKSNQKYTYEETTKEMSKLVDSAAGTFTASYDTEGKLTSEVYPNNMCANYTYNAVGEAIHIEYIKTTNCSESKPPVWFSETKVPSVRGETMSRTSTLSSETYTYDTIGRLTETQETPTGEYCKTRTYAYDEESNRTKLTMREPNSKKECATEGGTVQEHTYDEANRLTDSGIEYDPLGNVTKLPAADVESHELKSTFYVDNAVATQEQNGVKNEYLLDPNGRTRETLTGTKKTISHYDAPGEAIAWTCEIVSEKCSTSTWTRNIPGIDGTLSAIQTNGATPVLQLHDLEGDVIATADDNTTETKLLSTYNSTEFGVPNGGKAPPMFAWLGATGVQSSLATGVITYGATSYVPQIGRALQGTEVEPPGAPTGSGVGTPYRHELEPWILQGASREANEAPGIGVTEEREAQEAACRANPNSCSEDPAWSGDVSIQAAEAISGAIEGIEDVYYLGDGTLFELAVKAVEILNEYLHINFVTKLKEVLQKGLFGYNMNQVAQWTFSIGTLLDTCTKAVKGDKKAHCWLYIPTVVRHAYEGGPGMEIPNFAATFGWENPADVAVGYCPFGEYSKCYSADAYG